jgi:predicted dienelactone hydrolase
MGYKRIHTGQKISNALAGDFICRAAHICVLPSIVAIVILLAISASAQPDAYDPLHISDQPILRTIELTVNDSARQRDIPVLVYLPTQKGSAPVVFFSHGLGGSRYGCAYLGKHWSARGYAVFFVQHPGSDASVWQNVSRSNRMEALRKAANLQNLLFRVKDIPVVIDQLERWNVTKGHVLDGRLDLDRIGMSGHSFGARTTQAVSGQKTLRREASFSDPRIKAAIAFSPSSPRRGDPKQAFGNVKIPWLLMTGTKDVASIGNADLKSRLAVFQALPPGGKYELVLYKAEHSAFTDRSLSGDRERRNPNHHRVIIALSTAFWDAWLREDAAARAWLDGDSPRTLLENEDQWQTK